jgi:hypothetical protein
VTRLARSALSQTDVGLPAAAGPYPAVGQTATTAAGMRAAADLIDRSGTTGLSVTCADDRIGIQVTAGSGDAQARAAAVARLAACLGSAAVQEDSPAEGRSWIRAHGTAAGLPVEVFTALTVQEAAECNGQLLAAAPDGRIAAAMTPERLPRGWRWLTDLDTPAAAARGGDATDNGRDASSPGSAARDRTPPPAGEDLPS